VKAEWAGAGLVAHAPVLVDDIEAIGPTGVVAFGRIIKRVDDSGELDAKLHDAELAQFAAFIEALGAGENDVIVEIVGVLPDVAGMSLANVDHVEGDAVSVLLVQLIENGNLPPEGRSRIAAEDENDGFFAAQGRQLESCFVIRALE
jgi:hypothetical protein